MSVGLFPNATGPSSLKRLRIVEDSSNSSLDALFRGRDCPFPANVSVADGANSGTWPATNRDFGALKTLDELTIPATAAVLDMTDFSCAQTTYASTCAYQLFQTLQMQ